MPRLTDNDRHFGPVTYGPSDFKATRVVFSTGGGGDDDEDAFNNLTTYAFGWVARLKLPKLMQPYRIKHIADSWDAATVARMGRNWYFETFPREYGFSVSDGFLQVFLGPQTHDSSTTKSWSKFLPWTQWRHIRTSVFDTDGKHFWTEWSRPRGFALRDDWAASRAAKKACPVARFEIVDSDGQRIVATTHIEEREWRFGEGWFKWLSLFRSPKVRRSLDIEFASAVGPDKGSWKGGLIGTGIDMLPGELPEAAFRRYCGQEHRAKYGKYLITFVGHAAPAAFHPV